MARIENIYDENDTIVYPNTVPRAVRISATKTLEDKLTDTDNTIKDIKDQLQDFQNGVNKITEVINTNTGASVGDSNYLTSDSSPDDIVSVINSLSGGTEKYEYATVTTSGVNRTITLKNSYSKMILFKYGNENSGAEYHVNFVAPNTVNFQCKAAGDGVKTGEYTIPYVFIGE